MAKCTKTNSGSITFASDEGEIPVSQGTRGADPWTVRSNLDIARTQVIISAEFTASATGDTIYTLTKLISGAVDSTGTSIAVTSGKILRLTAGWFSIRAGANAAPFATLTLRQNPAGATILTSPTWGRISVYTTGAIISAADKTTWAWPEGIEFTGANTLGASVTCQATTNLLAFALFGYEYTPP